MKTITAFTISLLLLVISLTILGFAFNTITQSNDLVTNVETGKQVDQTVPYLVYGFVQTIIALFIMLNSIKTFHVFLDYYNNYRETKRDKDIIESIKDAEYDELYKDLNSTNISQQRMTIVNDFYKNKQKKLSKSSFSDLLDGLIKEKSLSL